MNLVDDAIHIRDAVPTRTMCGLSALPRRVVEQADPPPDGAAGCWTCLQAAQTLASRQRADADDASRLVAAVKRHHRAQGSSQRTAQERDAAIRAAARTMTNRRIATTAGLTPQRVAQIVNAKSPREAE